MFWDLITSYMQSTLIRQACPVPQALLFTAQNFSPCNPSYPTLGAESQTSGQLWKHKWWGGSTINKKERNKSVSLADARCCKIMTLTWTFLYLIGVFFSINSFKWGIMDWSATTSAIPDFELNRSYPDLVLSNNFNHTRVLLKQGLICILILLIQYWYDLLARPKCKAALNHGCTVLISPLSPGCCRICLQRVTELTVNSSQHFGTTHGSSREEAMLKWTCQSLAELEKRIQARF